MRSIVGAGILLIACRLQAGELQNLGRQLFFDKRLSADGTISCGSCHRPDRAFSEPYPVSVGVGGAKGKLNAPTVLNLQDAKRFFWDGRARSLEQQVEGPLLSEVEMGNTREALEQRLGGIEEYRRRFARTFGDERITLARIGKAIAAYERTLSSAQSLYDKWKMGRREGWNTDHELGRLLFFGEAGCAKCHSGQNFTNQRLVAARDGKLVKVPSLREVSNTAPYFHDGSVQTLLEVLDVHGKAAGLHEEEKRALVRFLESLSGEDWR